MKNCSQMKSQGNVERLVCLTVKSSVYNLHLLLWMVQGRLLDVNTLNSERTRLVQAQSFRSYEGPKNTVLTTTKIQELKNSAPLNYSVVLHQ